MAMIYWRYEVFRALAKYLLYKYDVWMLLFNKYDVDIQKDK